MSLTGAFMSKLQLYLRGAMFQQMDIELPAYQHLDDNEQKNFELNCQLRTEMVQAEAIRLKIQYLRQIIKCGYEYEIYLVADSKVEERYFLITD